MFINLQNVANFLVSFGHQEGERKLYLKLKCLSSPPSRPPGQYLLPLDLDLLLQPPLLLPLLLLLYLGLGGRL